MAKKSDKEIVVDYRALIKDVPTDKSFFCVDGSCIKNIEDLEKYLPIMSNEAFNFHVNSNKNDFASWVYDVIGDVILAEDLRKNTDKRKTIQLVSKRVSDIKKKLKLL